MDKVDLKKLHGDLYAAPRGRFVIVDVPPLTYLAVDGAGDPNSASAYAQAVEALFAASYAVKFASKNQLGRDYVVGPLEGLWAADDPAAFVRRDKPSWRWTMLVLLPDWIASAIVDEVVARVQRHEGPPGAQAAAASNPGRGSVGSDAARRLVRRRDAGASTSCTTHSCRSMG